MSRPALERRSAGTLLIQQGLASRALRSTFRASAAEAKERAERKRNRVGAALAVAAASKTLAPALASAIYDGRQGARSAARRRLSAELSELGISITGPQWVVGNRRGMDKLRADRAAESLASQWKARARVETTAEDELRVRDTLRTMSARLERTARTEIARAYSEEHREALRDVVEHDRRFRDGELADAITEVVRRRWSALADACEHCWPLDGEEVEIDESFPGGLEPGAVHPHCRCVEYLVRI